MIDQWQYCYDQGWGKNLVSESFSHPAKVSFSLAGKIYDHSINMKWVKRGDFVLDPFGGICGFGFHAMAYGLNFIGVELEEKFVKLGEQNIELWNRQLRGWPNLGTARIVQGDSRRLKEVIERADLLVSSPPYSIDVIRKRDIGKSNQGATQGKHSCDEYGHTPGNLANMKEGDIDCVISSPPYVDSVNSKRDGIDFSKAGRPDKMEKTSTKHYPIGAGADGDFNYGQSLGQLGSMKEGSIDAVISSPPYEESLSGIQGPGHGVKWNKIDYGKTDKNLGNSSGDTFWSASLEIVQQCYDLLKPNGHAIWVCKDYVKNKKRVPFSDRWLALCELVGFKLVCRHQALLVKEHGTQVTIHGEEKITTERKSFFRRLAESKGSPRIDWEDVLCLVKK